jgi:outer membrane protein TolC
MNQPQRKFWSLVLSATVLATGCQPTQPFYFREDGDLSHYLDVATDIEYPDVAEQSLDEVNNTLPPLTLTNTDNYEMWELSLEEAIRITLCNSQVMRQIGARVQSFAPETISRTLISPVAVTTTYDPALAESGYGAPTGLPFGGPAGVEAALSEFDARLDSSVFWEKNRRPQNRPGSGIGAAFSPSIFAQDSGNFTSGITKTTADGTTFAFRNNTIYEQNNTDPSFRPLASDWQTNFEASFSRPLLQGAGTQYNRIAGPHAIQQYAAGAPNAIDGVVVARINTDMTLADFEGSVRDLTRDVEDAYWELYFTYRDLEARKLGRDSALETWKKTASLLRSGAAGADREAQSRSQYFLFRGQVEQALTDLFRVENRLRYAMGIAMSDGRLIRPADEPTTAHVDFDWAAIHCESQVRRVEIRKEKWQIKKRELELIAARNHILPRLDAVGRYRWLGLGDDLIDTSRGTPLFNNDPMDPDFGNPQPGSNAFSTLTSGEFQEWQLGLQLHIPIGYRREMAQIRHHELLLARERAILQDLELEISHQLGEAIRDIDLQYGLTQTNFNRRVAAEMEVQAVQASYQAQRVTLDLLLDAQRRRAEAESAYYRSLIDYNKAIMGVHYRKGSLLDYNGVYLAEGPWPGKAYFDALREARKRDASMYLDYGFTRPNVFSRGPYQRDRAEGCEPGQPCDVGGYGPTPQPMIPQEQFAPQSISLPASDEAARAAPFQSPQTNPFRDAADRVTSIQPPNFDERQANYTAAAGAASPAVGQRTER